MAKPGSKPELAAKSGIQRTIPDSLTSIVVAGTQTDSVDALVAYAGTYVFVAARGTAVTIQRYTVGAEPTLAAGVGFTLADGEMQEFYVDPDGEMNLSHIGGGAGAIDISFDSDHAG